MFAGAVIQRELRVRSRQHLTRWLRVGVGSIATLISVLTLALGSPALGSAGVGKQLFLFLAWMGFAFCIVEGARSAADVISREKREGTLGLLVMTRLTGFEVILGKFAAVSVNSFYALLAVIPAMAIALPAGGLTAGEFWRTQVALLNALFLAVAAGLWVSSRSQDDTRALVGTLGLIGALILVPLILPMWPTISPGQVLAMAEAGDYGSSPGRFWASMLTVHAVAWFLLFLAGLHLAKHWRSEADLASAVSSPKEDPAQGYRIPPSLHADPKQSARALLEHHPVRWFSQRCHRDRGLVWFALFLAPAFRWVLGILVFRLAGVRSFASLTAGSLALELVSQLIVATVAARRVAATRSSGTMEVLLASPLSSREIVLGHWWGLWRLIRWPLILSSLLPAAVEMLVAAQRSGPGVPPLFYYVQQSLGVITHVAHLLAVCWLAMWFSARGRSPAGAAGITVLWSVFGVYLLHIVSLVTVSTLVRMCGAGPGSSSWLYWSSGLQSMFLFTYSLGLLWWARRRLLTRLRDATLHARFSHYR